MTTNGPQPLRTCGVWAIAGLLAFAANPRCYTQVITSGMRDPVVRAQNSTQNVPADAGQIVLKRGKGTIVLQPYGSNIVRVTLSTNRAAALAPPGYGIIGSPVKNGWDHQKAADGSDVVRSSSLVVRVAPESTPAPGEAPRNPIYQHLIDQIWPTGKPDEHRHNDLIQVTTPEGAPLLTLWGWSMYPNRAPAGEHITEQHSKLDPGYGISATFDSPLDEHYYGLGQHQQGDLDLRDRRINCWDDYSALGGQSVCVPFMISSRGYGFIWDNPSKTTIDLGVNQRNSWSSEVGDRISFFVIKGEKPDDIYEGYRKLTGVTHILPRAAYGYIQSKCIYPTQEQVMEVAKGYRERNLPLDVLVVDFLNMSKMGNMDLDPTRWPDPAGMNRELHSMGIKTMLSVWPHLATDSRYYDLVKRNGWFLQKADGTPDQSYWTDPIGPDIDTTNPEAAKWFWSVVRDNYIKKDGFSYIWLDETEPDIDPEKDYYYIGSGARYYNIYPLFHTASIYDGFRRDFGDSRRVMILARAAYLGAQRNGTLFWSSDITSSWDMLKRSIPAGLNFTASGMPYWDTDIGGYARRTIHADYKPLHPPLVDPSNAEAVVGNYSDLPELYVRWFQWATFQPVMRAHGERKENEVWSFGKQATPILEKYLRLRYQLIPYTYSLAYNTYQTGAPFMRALWMDFQHDPNVANTTDEYMFGPAILVAPVTMQGATTRAVYLPAGADWYNFWTNERFRGGQTINVAAPIDTLPLFVRSGSIIPLGSSVLNGDQPQTITSVRVYPGADADFALFKDDGETYAYENGHDSITHLHWDEGSRRLSHTGVAAWSGADSTVVDVIKPANGK